MVLVVFATDMMVIAVILVMVALTVVMIVAIVVVIAAFAKNRSPEFEIIFSKIQKRSIFPAFC